jgi:hypothetical protein
MYFDISDSLVLPKCILLDYEMIYFLIFTSFAFIGLYINIVLALLLLDVFWRFPTLTSIVNVLILIIIGNMASKWIDTFGALIIHNYVILLLFDSISLLCRILFSILLKSPLMFFIYFRCDIQN